MSAYTCIRLPSSGLFRVLLGLFALLTVAGMAMAWYIESNGHHVTGVSNAVPWGLTLTLATFCIVAASGALNMASLASVYNKEYYKATSRLSCLLALALLAGGLLTLLLDLGRPEQIFTVLTHYNFTSVFSINILIYTGFFVIVGLYGLCMLLAPGAVRAMGTASFLWRLIMTTGTGSVFGVLSGRGGMSSALMPPLFIALSLSLGLALFILTARLLNRAGEGAVSPIPAALEERFPPLLATFIAICFHMVLALFLIGFATPGLRAWTAFVVCGGNVYSWLLWGGFVLLGTMLPLALLLLPGCRKNPVCLTAAALVTALGGLALMYVLVVAPQAFPPDIFPGKIVEGPLSGVAAYCPTANEWLLGFTAFGIAGLMVLLGTRLLPLLPQSSSR